MKIRAIETSYKGYRFRSRLEARWAIFFDTLGVKWEYEKEGYELEGGKRYLPDFWLPMDKLWIEVKGEPPTEDYLNMLDAFRSSLNCAVLLVVGPPGQNPAYLMAYDTTDSTGGCYDNEGVDIAAVNSKGRLQLVSGDSRVLRDRIVYASQWDEELEVSYLPHRVFFPSVVKAIDAAKSARFEFGETPR